MSGRGKGKEGIGKGGAKRHRKLLRDNIEGVTVRLRLRGRAFSLADCTRARVPVRAAFACSHALAAPFSPPLRALAACARVRFARCKSPLALGHPLLLSPRSTLCQLAY